LHILSIVFRGKSSQKTEERGEVCLVRSSKSKGWKENKTEETRPRLIQKTGLSLPSSVTKRVNWGKEGS
jgi:hypothetical protein